MHSKFFDYIDPVAFNVFGIPVNWYGIAYALGAILGYFVLKRNASKVCGWDFGKPFYDDLIIYMLLGAVIGGRIGYMIIYDFGNFIQNPAEIFKTRNGGMSFHGGFFGVALFCYLLSCKHKIPYLRLSDLLASVAPIGLFFGRIANFVNAELYGRITEVSWGIVFPNSDGALRHPSQLYEACAEGIILFVILNLILRAQHKNKEEDNSCASAKQQGGFLKYSQPGFLTVVFVMLYSLFRFVIEYFREPDAHMNTFVFGFSMGQILSIIMLCIGLLLFLKLLYKNISLRTKSYV